MRWLGQRVGRIADDGFDRAACGGIVGRGGGFGAAVGHGRLRVCGLRLREDQGGARR